MGALLGWVGFLAIAAGFGVRAWAGFQSINSLPNFSNFYQYDFDWGVGYIPIGIGAILVLAGWAIHHRDIARVRRPELGLRNTAAIVTFLIGGLTAAGGVFYAAYEVRSEYYDHSFQTYKRFGVDLFVVEAVGGFLAGLGRLMWHLGEAERAP